MMPTSKFQSTWHYPFNDKSSVQKNITTTEDLALSKETNCITSPFETSSPHIVPLLISSPPSITHSQQEQQEQREQPTSLSKNFFNPFNHNNDSTIENDNELNDTDDLDDLSHFLSQQLLQEDDDMEKVIQINKSSTDQNKINKMMDTSTSWFTGNHHNKGDSNNTWSSSASSPFSFQKEQSSPSSLLFGFSSTTSTNVTTTTTATASIYNDNNDINNYDNKMDDQEGNNKEDRWKRFEPYVDESEFDPTIRLNTISSSFLLNGSSSTSLIHQQEEDIDDTSMNNNNEIKEGEEKDDDTIGKVLDHLISIFPNHDKMELLDKLKSFDYDLDKTVERIILSSVKSSLSSSSSSKTTELNKNSNKDDNNNSIHLTPSGSTSPIHQHELHSTIVIKKSSPVSTPIVSVPTTIVHTPVPPPSSSKKRQVCRHYLAGECYRKDCWFSHDLDIKPCKFWLQGSCFKGDTCEFAHSVEDIYLVEQVKNSTTSSSSIQHHPVDTSSSPVLHTPTVADFPIITKSNRKHKKSHNKKKTVK